MSSAPPSGYIKLSRKQFDGLDLFWGDGTKFDSRSAWTDLIQLAAWKPYKYRGIDQLERGEFVASVRFLAERWKWSKSAVARWLDRVQKAGRITGQRMGHHGRVYLIVNYDAYQDVPAEVGQSAGRGAVQKRDRSGTNENEVKQLKRTTSSVADAPKGDDASQDTASAPPSKPRRKGEPAPFMATFAPVWKAAYGGAMPQGSATALRPVVKELGEEEAVRRFAAYCKVTGGQYASVSKFCQTHGAYATSGTAQNRAGLWLAVCREFDLFSYSGNGDAYRAKVERAKASGKIGPAFDAELKVVRPWERLGDVAEPFVEREIANRLGRIAA